MIILYQKYLPDLRNHEMNVMYYNKDVNGFPKVDKPIKKDYELNDHLANLFEKAMHILDKELSYARYRAIAFLKPEVSNVGWNLLMTVNWRVASTALYSLLPA